jgi:hypothetical protein
MKRSDVFPSKWLRNEDLDGKPLVVTIQSAEMQELKSQDGKTQSKMVVSFKELPKSLALNLTNWDSISEICGDDSDSWPGGQIELFPAMTTMGNKRVACVRVRQPAQATTPPSQAPTRRPAPAVTEEVPFDDSIEF